MCVILKCPECEDRDCNFNAEGRCFDIGTIKENVPDGIYSCSDAKKDFHTMTDDELVAEYEKEAIDTSICIHKEDAESDMKDFYAVQEEMQKRSLINKESLPGFDEKTLELNELVANISMDDYGLLGFCVSENIDDYDETGSSIIRVYEENPEHALLLDKMLIAVCGYSIKSLVEEMENNRDYYNSL